MNILSSQQMKQIQEQLLNVKLLPSFQLKFTKINQICTFETASINILPQASQSTQLQIRKIVSLADNMSSLTLNDVNSTLKIFTITIFSILYKGKYRGNQSSDNSLLEAIKCSLFSPDVNLTAIKGIPASFNSSQMKALAAIFFQFMVKQRENFISQAFITSQLLLQQNQHLLNSFILFFRCILLALEVEGASNWKGQINQKQSLENLLDYFDLSYRQIGDMFLLYQQGLFISINQKQIVYGQYFENQAEKQNQKKQMEIKSSIKMNMIESFLVNINNDQRPSKKKSGIVDSDLKLFNFMLQSQEEQKNAHNQNDKDAQTPHFKDNQQFNFGKKKKQEPMYRPQQVRFQFQKLIKDESMEQIEPNDLINFNAQFQQIQAPTPFLGGQFNFNKQDKPSDSPSSLHQRSLSNPISFDHHNGISPKNRMSLADHSNAFTNSVSNPQNRTKKATTQICTSQNNNLNSNSYNFHSCICRQVRLKRNICTSKVVQFTFVPAINNRKQYFNSSISTKNINFKPQNPRTVTEGKSYTLNKQSTFKEKKLQAGEDRTPSFLKNMKKQNSNNPNHPIRAQQQSQQSIPQQSSNQQGYALSARQIAKRQKASTNTENDPKRKSTILPGESQILPSKFKARDDEGLAKMKASDNPQITSKKIELPGRGGGVGHSNSNWQTTSNFHQRNLTNASPINQAKSTFIGQPSPQAKNISPLKFFAPVQIIAPTVYLNSNGSDSNNNIVFKLSQLHQNSPKLIRGQHQSPFINKVQPNNKSDNHSNYNQLGK